MAILESRATDPRRQPDSSTVTARSNKFPSEILKDNFERALLFKKLATLQIDAPLFRDVEELRWRGATSSFVFWQKRSVLCVWRSVSVTWKPRLIDRSPLFDLQFVVRGALQMGSVGKSH
jgi:hypothetical protein